MAIASFIKDPAAILDYEMDWSDWLIGDTIATSTWTVPAGLTQVTSSSSAVVATIRLSGGTHGVDYEILNHIVTASGQEDERSILIQVLQSEAGSAADATDRANAVLELIEKAQIDVAPVLTQTEIEVILDRCKRASRWTSAHVYVPGDVIIPTTRNGHRYRTPNGGTSGSTEPGGFTSTSISEGATVYEGSLKWVEDGPDYGNVYDVREAAYQCWALKARKASQFIGAGELAFNQVYEHCRGQMYSLASVRIA